MRRLRQAIDAISFASEASTLTSIQATDAALDAVEQEIAELRKRPTLEQVQAAFERWVLEDGHRQDPNDVADAIEIVSALYAEKAAP